MSENRSIHRLIGVIFAMVLGHAILIIAIAIPELR